MPAICETCGIMISEDEGNKKDHKKEAHIDAFYGQRDTIVDKVCDLYTSVP
jgi:hypothetical protein